MFNWLKRLDSESSGLAEMERKFQRMLQDGRHCFDLACCAYLEGADSRIVRKELVETDLGINKLEREIRRSLIVHATVHGATEFPACLIFMSVTKDAERIGDYAKNILDVADHTPLRPESQYHAHLFDLKKRISSALVDIREIHDSQDEERAGEFIQNTEVLKDECDDKVVEILAIRGGGGIDPAEAAGAALCYRYLKRVTSHARNIATSLVVSVDRLDYFDEPDALRP